MEAVFAIGDKAVYPVHGVTEVVALEQREIGGHAIAVYILKVLENDSRIMVPTTKAQAVGLRGLISENQASEVFTLLQTKTDVRNDQTWNRRQREYMDKIKTGRIFEIAEVLRDLCLLGTGKQLSFSERRMLDTAKNLLVQEIAIARKTSESTVSGEIDAIFTKAAAA